MAVDIIEQHVYVGEFRADRRNRYSNSWYGGKNGEKAYVVRIEDRLYFTGEASYAFGSDPEDFDVVLTPKILASCVEAARAKDETRSEANGYRFTWLNATFLKFEAPCGATYRVPFEDLEIILQEFGD